MTRRARPQASRALKVSVWRDRLARTPSERETVWTMRRAHYLTVTVSRVSPEIAAVDARVTGDGCDPAGARMRWTVTASNAPADAPKIAAAVEVAKAWAERQADDAAAKSTMAGAS